MTTDAFIGKLTIRYPKAFMNKENQQDVIAQLEDIREGLQQYSYDRLERAWKLFKDHYVFQYAPKWASINKILIDHGLSPDKKIENQLTPSEQRKRDLLSNVFWKCLECGVSFGFVAEYCPKCRKMTERIAVKGEWPKGFLNVKEKCGICKKAHLDNASGRKCDMHGVDFGNKVPYSMCNTCACQDCCMEKRIEMNDKDKFNELNESKSLTTHYDGAEGFYERMDVKKKQLNKEIANLTEHKRFVIGVKKDGLRNNI